MDSRYDFLSWPAIVAHAIAVIVHSVTDVQRMPADWGTQTTILLLTGIALSLCLLVSRSASVVAAILVLKAILLGFVSFPTNSSLVTIVAAATALESASKLKQTSGWLYAVFLLAGVAFFSLIVPRGALPPRNLESVVVPITIVLVVFYITNRSKRLSSLFLSQRQTRERLDDTVRHLTQSNVLLQEYAAKSTAQERWRISREIHDIVGYALTNLRMMMELAHRITPADHRDLREIHDRAKEQARTGLDEVRRSLRSLRPTGDGSLLGQKGVFRLVDTFREATGVSVRLEFGNSRATYGESIDAAVYRTVQEGLTNAIRHGNASEITVLMWEHSSELTVTVDDNGVGADGIQDGIGMSGMKERLDPLGGMLERTNMKRGFRLRIRIPIVGRGSVSEELENG